MVRYLPPCLQRREGRTGIVLCTHCKGIRCRGLILFCAVIGLLFMAGCGYGGISGGPPPNGDVYVGTTLSRGFDEGVDTSQHITNWVTDHQGYQECDYPPGQQYGVVYITADTPTSVIADRQTLDYSMFRALEIDLKGAHGGETVDIGVKTATDPDNGQEPKYTVRNLTTNWQTISIPLTSFVQDPNYPPSRLKSLYVVCELVFEPGVPAETIFFRNIRYVK